MLAFNVCHSWNVISALNRALYGNMRTLSFAIVVPSKDTIPNSSKNGSPAGKNDGAKWNPP